jgi:ornithine cyclodeaminase/alanine dehydrogenase-like protein (mu-crystallin family)
LTALRTGTASAIATKYLSRKDSNSVGVIGNGAQSIPQLHALSLVRDIKTVYAYDTDKAATESFKKTVEKLLGVKVRVTDEEIVSRQSDVIVTVTCKERNTPPVVYNKWVANGVHINAVGGDSPNKVELEKSLVERSKLVVDFRDQAVYEGEAQQVSKDKIYADLAEIVTNQKDFRNDNEVTIFDSVGFAMEDLVTYKMIYKLATEQKIGKRINIASKPKYIKNIYESYFVK